MVDMTMRRIAYRDPEYPPLCVLYVYSMCLDLDFPVEQIFTELETGGGSRG